MQQLHHKTVCSNKAESSTAELETDLHCFKSTQCFQHFLILPCSITFLRKNYKQAYSITQYHTTDCTTQNGRHLDHVCYNACHRFVYLYFVTKCNYDLKRLKCFPG